MATKKAYDLAVVVGHYTDGTGAEKSRYQNVGVVLVKDDGGKFHPPGSLVQPGGDTVRREQGEYDPCLDV